ncbi:MAG: hypothetical protein AAGG07_00600 [Planctomycetota bacterium]
MSRPLQTLLDGLIDYAGLFPPAKLDMAPALEEFARQRMSGEAYALARFVCPASRLKELSDKGAALMPGTFATSGYREMADHSEPWGISALLPGDLEGVERGLDTIDAFNEHHSAEGAGLARVDMIELPATEPGFIDDALDLIPSDIMPFFEIDWRGDCRGSVAALAGNDAAAKIRCGGVTEDLIPPSEAVAAFINACRAGDVPFKATAGLHHPVRAEHALTYEPDAPRGVMHGFLNVFIGAALLKARAIEPDRLVDVLEETDASAFTFDREGAGWRDARVDLIGLASARERFCLSYGSCSFSEPMRDLRELGLLAAR